MIWLSAADSEILEECPKWERLKYAAFGASILVPFLFGMIASSYAISTLTTNWYIIGGFSLVWGFIIITIDRVLLSTYRAFVPFSHKVAQFVLRITVAVLMGLTVSHPLTLLLFKDTIISEIERARMEEMAKTRESADKEKKDLDTRILQAVENLQKQEKRYEEVIAGGFLNNVQPAAPPAPVQTVVNTHSNEIENQIKEYKKERDQVQIDLNRFQRTYDEEISGARTGKPGIGPNARAIERDELVWRREEVKRLGGVIADLTRKQTEMSSKLLADSAAANAVVEASKRQLEQQKIQLFASQQGEMVEVVKGQIASASAELDRLREEAKKLSLDSDERVDSLKGEKRLDLMVQTLVLHEIFKKPGGGFALAVYIVIGSLFTLIDIIPLVVKFFAVPGIYDYYQELKETGKIDKTNGEVDKIVGKVDAKATAKENSENPEKTQEEVIKLKKDLVTKEIEKILNSNTLSAFDKLDQIESIRVYKPKDITSAESVVAVSHFETEVFHDFIKKEVEKVIGVENPMMSVFDKLNLIKSIQDFKPTDLTQEERKAIIVHVLEKTGKGEQSPNRENDLGTSEGTHHDDLAGSGAPLEDQISDKKIVDATDQFRHGEGGSPKEVPSLGRSADAKVDSKPIKSFNGNHKELTPVQIKNEIPVSEKSTELSSSPSDLPGTQSGHQHPAKVEPQEEVGGAVARSQPFVGLGQSSKGSEKRPKNLLDAHLKPIPRKVEGRAQIVPSSLMDEAQEVKIEPTVQDSPKPVTQVPSRLSSSDFLDEPSGFIAAQLGGVLNSESTKPDLSSWQTLRRNIDSGPGKISVTPLGAQVDVATGETS